MRKIFTILGLLTVANMAFGQQEETFATPFSSDRITFWIGDGENEATAIFYWCQDIRAGLAWGYRWNGVKTIGDMLDEIDAADSRLTIDGGEWINSYSYQDANFNQHIATSGYLTYTINGDWNMFLNMTDTLHAGDVFQMQEWGNCEIPESVYPASDVNAPDSLFSGMVGAPDCQAIYFEDEHILGWATGCTIERGWQNIATHQLKASFGTEQDALGASSLNTMECVSLGDGGVATLTFDIPIENGDGYDFAVFENSLDGFFLELALVEVSSDGEHFVRFPASSMTSTETQVGTFDTVYANKINNLAGKYTIGWGVPFDLEELAGAENLNINNITHVRVIDVVGTMNPEYATRDRHGRMINDPYPTNFNSCGFDLSGVAVLNGWKPVGISDYAATQTHAYPNPCTEVIHITSEQGRSIELYNINGQLLNSVKSSNNITKLDMQQYPAGVYILKVGNNVQKILKK